MRALFKIGAVIAAIFVASLYMAAQTGCGGAADPSSISDDGSGVGDVAGEGQEQEEGQDQDGDGGGTDSSQEAEKTDTDGDGVPDETDNCPDVDNPDQSDVDDDAVGDLCDDDDDDGVLDVDDNCADVANALQLDYDGDDVGDACDACQEGGIELIAVKYYDPSEWFHAEATLEGQMSFEIPTELAVTAGNAGNHWAYIFYTDEDGDEVQCYYQGGSSQSHPSTPAEIAKGLKYNISLGSRNAHFGHDPTVACTNGLVVADITGGTTVVGSSFRVEVDNGDSNVPADDPRTEVTLIILDADCP